jgi:hypothetical protein
MKARSTWTPRLVSSDGSLADARNPDPIFAAIQAHRDATAAWSAVSKREPQNSAGTAAYRVWEAENVDAARDEAAAAAEAVKTVPRTVDGLLHFMKYVCEARIFWEDHELSEMAFLNAMKAVITLDIGGRQ